MSEYALDIENLSYSYRSHWHGAKTRVLHAISFQVKPGESFGFLGHNGAGKTTTIKCLLGLLRPESGRIRLFGEEHSNPEIRGVVGYLPEQPYFYDHLSVQELMQMYACLSGVNRGSIPTQVDRALSSVGMTGKASTPMRALSKGLTQRVALAQAIVGNPKLLILDEPFSGLDPIGRKHFKDLLFELKATGTTIFVSSHILGDIEFLCDRASIMSHGVIKEVFALDDLPEMLAASYELIVRNYEPVEKQLTSLSDSHEVQDKYLKLTFSHLEAADKALACVIQSDALVESYQMKHGSLEDLFVKLVQFEEAGGH